MRKNLSGIISAAALLAGIGCGCCNASVQTELCQTRWKLEQYYTGTQSEMTMISGFQLALAQMELDHLRYTIFNQADYEKIEAGFMADERDWEKRFKEEMDKPSEFEGGSIAPMERNRRLTALIEQRIAGLKKNWNSK